MIHFKEELTIMTPQPVPRASALDWEYVLNDLLEMSCFLNPGQRLALMDELRKEETPPEVIDIHPAFSIGKRLIAVVEGDSISECWIYYPRNKRITKCRAAEK